MGATINCGIGWRTAISMWRWRFHRHADRRGAGGFLSGTYGVGHRELAVTGSRRRRDRHRRRRPVILGALPVPAGQSAGHRRTHRRHAVPPRRIHSRGCGPGTSYAIASAYPPATTGGARSMISSTARAGASAPLTGMIPAGTVGSRLIVVEHGLDVVAIGIMDERGIVARPVVRARTGLAVVGAAGRETRLMERLDGVGGLGAERDV